MLLCDVCLGELNKTLCNFRTQLYISHSRLRFQKDQGSPPLYFTRMDNERLMVEICNEYFVYNIYNVSILCIWQLLWFQCFRYYL